MRVSIPSTSHLVLSAVEGHGRRSVYPSTFIHGNNDRIGGAIAATVACAYISATVY
jgi:hypothetical protein